MFESAEVGNAVDKKSYEKRLERLRTDLLKAQTALAATKSRLLVLVGGVEGGGKTEVARLFLEWMDPRGLQVEAYGDKSDEEEERPEYWRYWRTLPASGRGAVLVGSWYARPIVQRVFKEISEGDFDMAMDRAAAFESMLAREGTVIVKVWLHLSKKEQSRRFTELEKDPATSWRVTKQDWVFSSKYGRFRKICERALAKTGTADAPWTVVEATDRRYRDLTTGETVLKAMQDAIASAKLPEPGKSPDRAKPPKVSLLTRLDLSKALAGKDYDHKMMRQQARIARLSRRLRTDGRALIAVFEGADAAGQGGAMRGLLPAMDALNVTFMSVATPTDEEPARPYLWRFWRNLPRLGHATIYDRSWYGRVLVERVEGFCAARDWKRAYAEIAAFEEELSESGVIVVKFWLQISPEEQLRRFKHRTATPFKQYKITQEDWRNRAKWDSYQAAAVEMFERTSTPFAPWTLVESEDKRWARVKILKTVADRLEDELG